VMAVLAKASEGWSRMPYLLTGQDEKPFVSQLDDVLNSALGIHNLLHKPF
jgi:hypothetical protein